MSAPSQCVKLMTSGPGDAGEEILVAAGEADDLVREHRPADHELVVVEDTLVQRHADRLLETSAGERADLLGGDLADLRERRRIAPFVVEDARLAGAAVDDRNADMTRELRVGHRLVRAERDEEIERLRATAERLADQREHPRHRHRARAVRNDEQHALAVECERREAGVNDVARLIVGQEPVGESSPVHGVNATRGDERRAQPGLIARGPDLRDAGKLLSRSRRPPPALCRLAGRAVRNAGERSWTASSCESLRRRRRGRPGCPR